MRESHDRISSQFQPGRAGTKGHFGAGDRPQGVGARLRRGAHPVFRDHADDGSERLQPQSVRQSKLGPPTGRRTLRPPAAPLACPPGAPGSGRSTLRSTGPGGTSLLLRPFAPSPSVVVRLAPRRRRSGDRQGVASRGPAPCHHVVNSDDRSVVPPHCCFSVGLTRGSSRTRW